MTLRMWLPLALALSVSACAEKDDGRVVHLNGRLEAPLVEPDAQDTVEFEVEFNESGQVLIDGELIGQLPMRFEIAPHSLEVIVP